MAAKPAKRKPRLKPPVCKPCWELKYCPYGPLVETFPLAPEDFSLTQIRKIHKEAKSNLTSGKLQSEHDIHAEIERYLWSDPPNWEYIKEYRTDELTCSVFGHICPVFFAAEPFTETREGRKVGRHIPREVVLKVVRRDGQICQKCHKPVPDDEVEFDHVIPVARGGPSTPENIRLLCLPCNRSKGDSLTELLEDPR